MRIILAGCAFLDALVFVFTGSGPALPLGLAIGGFLSRTA